MRRKKGKKMHVLIFFRKPFGLRNLREKVFFFLSFSVGGKISRIKTSSHMLLFTIGIQHNTSPTATQTEREREMWRVRVKDFF